MFTSSSNQARFLGASWKCDTYAGPNREKLLASSVHGPPTSPRICTQLNALVSPAGNSQFTSVVTDFVLTCKVKLGRLDCSKISAHFQTLQKEIGHQCHVEEAFFISDVIVSDQLASLDVLLRLLSQGNALLLGQK